MKNLFRPTAVNAAIAALIILASCKKENSLTSGDNAAIAATVQTQAIAVSASPTANGDSVYVINTCYRNSKLDTIASGNLPSSVTDYLTANYSGYTFQKAYEVKDTSGTLQSYVVVIWFNSNPVGLKFDATGSFVQVLEQREGHDLPGIGWHRGGRFDNRDGKQRDTIALSALPEVITSYFASGYSADTLIRAYRLKDSSYILLSNNNGVFATVFNSSGVFVNRVELPAQRGNATAIDQSAVPSNALSYLSSSYPGYVFSKAISINSNGIVQGYIVVIDANNTMYGVLFDSSGNFVMVKPVR